MINLTRVVTLAMLTATVAAAVGMKNNGYTQQGNYSEKYNCIKTFMELEESLFSLKSNINCLYQAFLNLPATVNVLVHFSTSLRTTSFQKLCNPSTTRLDNNTFDYKLRWSASTVLYFLKPEVLKFLSLFVYQGAVTTAEVVIDPICESLDQPKEILESLCIHLESYVLNRNTKVNVELAGYCRCLDTDLQIFGNHVEDIIVAQQVFLAAAILFLCLIIAIRVPAALYSVSVVSITGERGFEETVWADRLQRQILYKIKESSYIYYFFGIFTIAPFLDIGIIIFNICILNTYEMTPMIVGFSTTIILFSTIELILIPVLAHRNKDKFNHWKILPRILYGVGVFSVVLALQLLVFHGTFILLAFLSAPLPTVSFTLIYVSFLFSLFCVAGTVIKVVYKYKCHKEEMLEKKYHYVFQIMAVTLLFLCVLSFDALFLTVMMYRAQRNHSEISDFFGALLPTTVITFISFGGNKLIGMVKSDEESSTPGDGNGKEPFIPGEGNGEKPLIPGDGNGEKPLIPGDGNGEEICNENPTTTIAISGPKHRAHSLCNKTSKQTKKQLLRKTSL